MFTLILCNGRISFQKRGGAHCLLRYTFLCGHPDILKKRLIIAGLWWAVATIATETKMSEWRRISQPHPSLEQPGRLENQYRRVGGA